MLASMIPLPNRKCVWKPTHLLAYASEQTFHDTAAVLAPYSFSKMTDGVCAICGSAIEEGARIKDVLSSKFTDLSVFQAPSSDYLCRDCVYCIAAPSTEGNKKRRFVAQSWLATPEGITLFDRKKDGWIHIVQTLWNPPKEPFLFLIHTAGKKHMSYRAKVNYSREAFFVQYEDLTIPVIREEHQPLFESLLALREAKVPIGVMESGGWGTGATPKKYKDVWERHEGIIKRWLNTDVLNFLIAVSGAYQKVQAKAKEME